MVLAIVVFFVLLIIGVPVAHVVLGAAAAGILAGGTAGTLLAQQTVLGMNSYVILCVPFFIISGDLAAKGQTSQKLVNAINALMGHLPGGLGIATIFSCALFGAITGSSIACVVAIGALMLPKLLEAGYPKPLVLGIITTAGTLGVMIPPSVPMLQISVAMGVSVAQGFLSGVIPGILCAVLMSVYVFLRAKKLNLPRAEKKTIREILHTLADSFWALMFPVIILGSIYGGIATPTEAAVISVYYALAVSVLVYKTIKPSEILSVCMESLKTIAPILFVLSAAVSFGRVLALMNVPQMVGSWITSSFTEKWQILLVVNIFLIFVGMVMDAAPAILILTPILAPVMSAIDVDLIHFGIMLVVNLAVGFVTPPVGINLFVASSMTKLPVIKLAKVCIPFTILFAIGLVLIIIFEDISLCLIR